MDKGSLPPLKNAEVLLVLEKESHLMTKINIMGADITMSRFSLLAISTTLLYSEKKVGTTRIMETTTSKRRAYNGEEAYVEGGWVLVSMTQTYDLCLLY